jgi:SAM-dependent methyltransferase
MTERATRTARVLELFDAKAATWSMKYAPGGRLSGRLTWLAAATQAVTAVDDQVLDLGCGAGDLSRELAAAGLRVTGCDISAPMLASAAGQDRDHLVAWTALDPAWQRLPFQDQTFGTIVASSLLEYLDRPQAALGECARVLRPGGTLLCTVPNLRNPVRWLEWLAAVGARRPAMASPARTLLPRLDAYLTYLLVSRQRHTTRWWSGAAACAGLRAAAAAPAGWSPGGCAPLRLCTFRKPEEPL